jgi:hypothetical protein
LVKREVGVDYTYQIRVRRGTTTQWNLSNPILADGEPGYATDLNKYKIGDGTTAWMDLPWAIGEAGDSATVNIGTTLTGNPGTAASVENVGTANDAILDFVIPEGLQGDPGPQGEKGDPGVGAPDPTGATDGHVWTADGADGAGWEAVPGGGSGPDPTGATDGHVWTADGADGAAWEAPSGGGPDPTGATDGHVWTADGANGAAWEAVPPSGGPDPTGITDGHVWTADGADGAAWEAVPSEFIAVDGVDDIPVDATTDQVYLVYDPLSTVGSVSGPTVVGLTTSGNKDAVPTSIVRPIGLEDGDWLFAFVVDQSSSGTGDYTSTGFSRVGPAYQDPDGTHRFSGVYAKKVTDASSEPTSYTFTTGWAANSNRKTISMVAVRGADGTTPVDAFTTYASAGDKGEPAWAAVTASTSGLWLGCVGASNGSPNTGTLSSFDAGMTHVSDWIFPTRDGTLSTTSNHILSADVTAGSNGPYAATFTTDPAQHSTFAIVVV